MDSSPSILIVPEYSTDTTIRRRNHKHHTRVPPQLPARNLILIDCGEGIPQHGLQNTPDGKPVTYHPPPDSSASIQEESTTSTTPRLTTPKFHPLKLHALCCTTLRHASVGGIPSLLLRMAEVQHQRSFNVAAAARAVPGRPSLSSMEDAVSVPNGNNHKNHKNINPNNTLYWIGPVGLQAHVHALDKLFSLKRLQTGRRQELQPPPPPQEQHSTNHHHHHVPPPPPPWTLQVQESPRQASTVSSTTTTLVPPQRRSWTRVVPSDPQSDSSSSSFPVEEQQAPSAHPLTIQTLAVPSSGPSSSSPVSRSNRTQRLPLQQQEQLQQQQEQEQPQHQEQEQQWLVSYLFTSPPLPGKFVVERAQALQVPPGRLYGKLQRGESVTFELGTKPNNNTKTRTKRKTMEKQAPPMPCTTNDDNNHNENKVGTKASPPTATTPEQRTVHSHQVMDPPKPGIGILVLRLPLHVHELDRFYQEYCTHTALSHALQQQPVSDNEEKEGNPLLPHQPNQPPTSRLDLVICLAHSAVYYHETSVEWRRQLTHVLQQQQQQQQQPDPQPCSTTSPSDNTYDTPRNDSSKNHTSDSSSFEAPQHVWINLDNPHHSVSNRGQQDTNVALATPQWESGQSSYLRSILCPSVYKSLWPSSQATDKTVPAPPDPASLAASGSRTTSTSTSTQSVITPVEAVPGMTFQIFPRNKQGFVTSHHRPTKDTTQQPPIHPYNDPELASRWRMERQRLQEWVVASGAMEAVRPIIQQQQQQQSRPEHSTRLIQNFPSWRLARGTPDLLGSRLIFTGTGSGFPCRHRSSAGIVLESTWASSVPHQRPWQQSPPSPQQQQKQRRSMLLLDIGEGTIGRLLRTLDHDGHAGDALSQDQILNDIKAVWISHFHADHYLGLLRLLEERPRYYKHDQKFNQEDRLLVIAPPLVLEFLHNHVQGVHLSMAQAYQGMDCRAFVDKNFNQYHYRKNQKIFTAFTGLKSCTAVQVHHCPYSYAVIVEGSDFGRLVYSGDCRPSPTLVYQAHGADLLIHEATVEEGREEDAIRAKHSTVGEALDVAEQMNAKAVVLTHFSSRYPKVPPPIPTTTGNDKDHPKYHHHHQRPIICAADCMILTPQNLVLASQLTPALRLLHPNEDPDENEALMEEESSVE